MRLRLLVALALLLVPARGATETCSESLAVVFERVSPAVVSIQATKINKAKARAS